MTEKSKEELRFDLNTPLARSSDIVIQENRDGILLYDLKTNKAHHLNESATHVWKHCDGKRSIKEISNDLSLQLKTAVSEDFVLLAIDQLNQDRLLEDTKDVAGELEGISRRELVRKIGFASIITLPIVSSIVAPKAAVAQSCVGNNTNCSAPSQCCSGNCQNGNLGQKCCSPSATINNTAPGSVIACAANQGVCSSFGGPRCCSGSATLGAVGVCGLLNECICD